MSILEADRYRPQLLTYPDSLGGSLRSIRSLLDGPLRGLFEGVHILPPFPSSGDRGFAPVRYDTIEPAFGTWSDIEALATDHDVMLDLMVNHISRASDQFQDLQRYGRASRFADLFVTMEKVWPGGQPRAEDVARIFLRKPDAPFSVVDVADTGENVQVWTSFGTADWSEQVDLDVTSPATRELISGWLKLFAGHGVRMVRLDAVGYVIKKAGTSCFMVEPEIWAFMNWISEVASSMGMLALPEVHDEQATHAAISAHGLWTYDFVLPGLVLHALETGDGRRLAAHLERSPPRQFTNLDCHDGIPVRPDLDGLLELDEMARLAHGVEQRGGNVNRILSRAHASGSDVHQLNIAYYSALDCDDERYLAARAIQLFARGVPQIYYVGLLAGENDHDAVERTGESRAINRHDYSLPEIDVALERPVVRRLVDLIRLRNSHPAFGGHLISATADGANLHMAWGNGGASCSLEVDLVSGRLSVQNNPASADVPDRVSAR